MNDDFTDILQALTDSGARFIVVGAHALAVHGVPRATGDLDIWIEPTSANAERVWHALAQFGAPVETLGIAPADFTVADAVVQIGVPPGRIDVMTGISGLTFEEAWQERLVQTIGGTSLPFLGRASFIRNKRATGRLKDLADLEALGEKHE